MSNARHRIRSLVALSAVITTLAVTLVTAAAEEHGFVTFNGLPVPGATVTAIQGDKQPAATSDESGRFVLAGLDESAYTLRVEMLGFATVTREVTPGEEIGARTFELSLLPFEEVRKRATIAKPVVIETLTVDAGASEQAAFVDPELERQAAEGLLVNGSVNNAAASPFAQARGFGNNRPGQRSLYSGGFGFTLGSSALDARPFSFAGARVAKPDYTDTQFAASFGGPFRIPGVRNRPVLFAGYQRNADHSALTQSAVVPTNPQRAGNFSGEREIRDPDTGLAFPGNVIPASRISPQAAALLALYPAPNVDGGPYNYQATTVTNTNVDSFQSRLNHGLTSRDALLVTTAFQRTNTNAESVFGFVDSQTSSTVDTAVTWSHRFNQFFTMRVGYQHVRQAIDSTPHFANVANISGEAGIDGNNQDAVNWGPPALVFANGVAGLATSQYMRQTSHTHGVTSEGLWRTRGGHNFTFGGAMRPQAVDVFGQQNARGTFGFDGSVTGSALADFLLGAPHSAALAFGNADKRLTARAMNAYVTDDWRVNPTVSVNYGLRWEYESPFAEAGGRLVNLDVARDFTSATPVVGAGIRSDKRGFQPRLGVAVRPVAGSSLVIRAGYGIYRNTSVYQSLALMLAQQPPLSRTLSVERTADLPLTLADGFRSPAKPLANTFAIDPEFRVSYAHNWQASVQRDLPASLTVTATYLGTKGSRLMQQFVPNTYPVGAVTPCPACPSGFVYLTSNGTSLKNAAQLQIRRRLRNGLAAVAQYTFSKATDDAAAFTTAALNGAVVAQNWLDLDAEHARSSFDQRHLVTAEVEYAGRGWLRDWTFTSQLLAGSGLPLTPVYLTTLAGTGLTGALRASFTGAPVNAAPEGFYVNPAAFAAPAEGEWGNAPRNSITGPAQFSLNAGVTRTFVINGRWSMDWRLDATNVLNRVTYASLDTIVGSPQFGLPNRANTMRKLLSTLRVRF